MYKLVIIKDNSNLQKWMLKHKIQGLTLWPFIIIRSKELAQDSRVLTHEKIHICQQQELFIVGFYIWYLFDTFLNGLIRFDWDSANNCFEKEAYGYEHNTCYPSTRKHFAFLKFIWE